MTDQKGITIELKFVDFDKFQYKIVSDKNRLRQVTLNLLINAIMNSRKGDKILILVQISENEDLTAQLIVSVKDQGYGLIEAEKVELQ